MSPQTTESRIRAGNPVPRLDDPPMGAIEADALFALLEKERWDMTTTKVRPAPPNTPRGRGRGMLLAAATFAVVLIVGISLAFTGLGSEKEPDVGGTVVTTEAPTTTSPVSTTDSPQASVAPSTQAPPTTEAPRPDPADAATIDNALTLYSSGDVEQLMALITESAELRDGPETRPNDRLSRETFQMYAEFAATINERFELGECRMHGDLISCDVEMSDDLTRGAGVENVAGSMAFRVDGGQITFWRTDKGLARDQGSRLAMARFVTWHQEAHPDDPEFYGPPDVVYTWDRLGSGVELIPLRIAEYLDTLG